MTEKVLVLILRCSGILLLTALIPVVMPFYWMQEIHRWLGMGELPTEPIVGYLTRSLSLLYAMHGALILYISGNISRFLPVVKCLALLGLGFGIVMIFLDIGVGMPFVWTLCEGPFLILLSIVIFWLACKTGES